MFWKKGDSAAAAESAKPTSTSSDASSFTLEDRLQRVSRDDLAAVTVEDIQRLKATIDNETLAAAMQAMMESNRFSDVLSCSSSATWNAAARDVTPAQMGVIGSLVRQRASLLYSVLPFVSEDFLEIMRAAFTTRSEEV